MRRPTTPALLLLATGGDVPVHSFSTVSYDFSSQAVTPLRVRSGIHRRCERSHQSQSTTRGGNGERQIIRGGGLNLFSRQLPDADAGRIPPPPDEADRHGAKQAGRNSGDRAADIQKWKGEVAQRTAVAVAFGGGSALLLRKRSSTGAGSDSDRESENATNKKRFDDIMSEVDDDEGSDDTGSLVAAATSGENGNASVSPQVFGGGSVLMLRKRNSTNDGSIHDRESENATNKQCFDDIMNGVDDGDGDGTTGSRVAAAATSEENYVNESASPHVLHREQKIEDRQKSDPVSSEDSELPVSEDGDADEHGKYSNAGALADFIEEKGKIADDLAEDADVIDTDLLLHNYTESATDVVDNLQFAAQSALFSVLVDLSQVFISPTSSSGRTLAETTLSAWTIIDYANIMDGLGVLGFGVATWKLGVILQESLDANEDLSRDAILDVLGIMKRSWAYATVSLGTGSVAVAVGFGTGLGKDFAVLYGPAILIALCIAGGIIGSIQFDQWVADAEINRKVNADTPAIASMELSSAIKTEGLAALRNLGICAAGFALYGASQLLALVASEDSVLDKAVGATDVIEQWVITGLLLSLMEKMLPVILRLAGGTVREDEDEEMSIYIGLYEAKKGAYHKVGETLAYAAGFALLATLYSASGFE